jgi:DNA/RNA endonuclease YhcR with UshA esterase domain
MLIKLRKRFISRAVAVGFAASFAALINVAAQHANRAPASPVTGKLITIAAARALPPGTVVTVEGTISVHPGAFRSTTSDESFAIQDESGGICVRMRLNPGLRVSQRVRVRGRIADSFGQLTLAPALESDVKVLGRARGVRPKPISTGQVNEATEGMIVKVTGTITKPVGDDLPYGYRVFIDDGSGEVQAFVHRSTGIRVASLQPGLRISVSGLSGQYNEHYEVMPRAPSDIRLSR